LLAVSVVAVSAEVESIIVESVDIIALESETVVESVDPSEVPLDLQAATDKVIAKAKKPNLNAFFIIIDLNFLFG
jgi:hypothetical protein